jgi:N-acetylneuraminic acid mutarotase
MKKNMTMVQWSMIIWWMILAPNAQARWGVGNGGDGARLQFLKAKEHASHVVMRLSPKALKQLKIDQDVIEWLEENKNALAADISQSSHVWTDEKQPTCAHTDLSPAADIIFYFDACKNSLAGFSEAAMLLVHESVHHFGISHSEGSHDFADQIAIAVYSAWHAGKIEWLHLNSTGAPESTAQHSSVWTGKEVLIFGGLTDYQNATATNSLASYSPAEDRWKTLSSQGAPKIHRHKAIWTGTQMIVYGGVSSKKRGSSISQTWHNSGAVYDPKKDQWSPIVNPYGPATISIQHPDAQAQSMVWTGEEILIWGGAEKSGNSYQAVDGAAYNPKTGKWRQLASNPSMGRRRAHTAVWTGEEMIVFGGVDLNNRYTETGASYNPSTNKWRDISQTNAPSGLDSHTAVWSGSRMIVFGGYYSSRNVIGVGGVYDPRTDSWVQIDTEIAFGRVGHSAVWTGEEMLIWGGRSRRPFITFNGVSAFNPETGAWRAVTSANAPSPRYDQTAVWIGNKMLVHGGMGDHNKVFGDGGVYYP